VQKGVQKGERNRHAFCGWGARLSELRALLLCALPQPRAAEGALVLLAVFFHRAMRALAGVLRRVFLVLVLAAVWAVRIIACTSPGALRSIVLGGCCSIAGGRLLVGESRRRSLGCDCSVRIVLIAVATVLAGVVGRAEQIVCRR
jgi:hypothetical protein